MTTHWATRAVANLQILRQRPLSHMQMFRIDEAAAMIGCSESELHRMIHRGDLRGMVKVYGRFRTSYPEHGEASSHMQAIEVARAMIKGSHRREELREEER